jgi:multimeric flavodoxin WrbA
VRGLAINCTLKPSPEQSNTDSLLEIVLGGLQKEGVEIDQVRAVDHDIKPGVESDMGEGDEWPPIREKIVNADILVIATPTWLGKPSSVCQRVMERMDAMLGETDDEGRPIAYNRVAGVVVTGNEDGAHHVIAETAGSLIDIGFTVPGQAWTYWNKGPGPGPSFLETDDGHDWSRTTGETAAQNLFAVARALEATPMLPPPS